MFMSFRVAIKYTHYKTYIKLFQLVPNQFVMTTTFPPCSLVTADTRISLMVNQRFWGRECRQVLGHLQPPQMSLEEIRCSFADASYSRIVGGLLMELRYGYAGYAMGMPQKSWEWKQKRDRFPSGPKPYSSLLLLRSWEICLQNSAWDALSRAWCGFGLACW